MKAAPPPGEILARLGGRCAAEYKYDGVRVQAHRTADGAIELFTRRLERFSAQFPDVVELLRAGLRPAEAILEGEVVAYDAAAGELRPFGEVMLRRRKHGIGQAVRDVPVGVFCFELLYADGEDLTMLPYPQRRAALEAALALSPRLRLTTAAEVAGPAALDAIFAQAVTDGCEGLVCKSAGPDSAYQAGARGWQWIKLKRDYRTELSDTADLVVIGAFAGRGRRAGGYGAVLLAAYDADLSPNYTAAWGQFSGVTDRADLHSPTGEYWGWGPLTSSAMSSTASAWPPGRATAMATAGGPGIACGTFCTTALFTWKLDAPTSPAWPARGRRRRRTAPLAPRPALQPAKVR